MAGNVPLDSGLTEIEIENSIYQSTQSTAVHCWTKASSKLRHNTRFSVFRIQSISFLIQNKYSYCFFFNNTKYNSCVVGAFTNIQSIYTNPDPEQLSVGHTNI